MICCVPVHNHFFFRTNYHLFDYTLDFATMPGTLISDAPFSTTTCKPLHPSLSAEVLGADFNNMSEKQFQESKGAIAKVCLNCYLICQLLIYSSILCFSLATLTSLTKTLLD